ncbi:hypothetical protein [Actinoplanes sp. OR16]|uniref:hypothetical protein n=1 Tax=Actinoplanes sp. OR16 TaxID=946334 RepID=UPI000FD8F207|nr:hypothetical protein [Actinoplanes sp. OR16]
MAWCFAIGSLFFLVGPLDVYADLVGPTADAVTFFIGSIFFTAGGFLQIRNSRSRGERWAAVIQSFGTLYFNFSTARAIVVTTSDSAYDHVVWRPDLFGSICFLISGVIGLAAAGWRGWQPYVNLLGCVFFMISALASFVWPSDSTEVSGTVAGVNTSLGAACFLICALAGLRTSGSSGRSDAAAGASR